jgi:hypothetical protein
MILGICSPSEKDVWKRYKSENGIVVVREDEGKRNVIQQSMSE